MTTFKQVQEYTVSCPNDDDGRIVKNGTQRGHQRYLCKMCGKNFRKPDAFQRSRHFPIQQKGLLRPSPTLQKNQIKCYSSTYPM